MAKGPTSFSDLSTLGELLHCPDMGRDVATAHLGKFIGNKGLVIACDENQLVTKDFWRAYLSVKHERLKAVTKLQLVGLNEETALNLALVMHDMRIKPRNIIFDGESCNA
ncbi:hypothetical protein SM033_00306 [Vibrio phage vB_VpaM_sm033]|nr:hypothetical protein SM033_00306 [Vibrio phage vB_VpaM_sm033]